MIVDVTPLVDPAHHTSGRRLAWLAAGLDLRPLGTAFLWIPVSGDAADLELHVHPAERRAGVGTQLLEAVTATAAEEGMRSLRSGAVRQGSAGEHFCVAHSLRRVLALTYTRLPLDGEQPAPHGTRPALDGQQPAPHDTRPALDGQQPALHGTRPAPDGEGPVGVPAPGYRLIHWDGVVPDALADTFARSRRAMDDMPMGEAASAPQPWDVERLHAIAAAVATRGEILCTTAVVAADGEIAGFTELVLPGDGRGDGRHYGTGVLPEHRGRGLARWMKAEQIARTRDRFPGLTGLLTDTADDNAAMRRVNDSLGYRPTHRSALYERRLSRDEPSLSQDEPSPGRGESSDERSLSRS